MLSCKKAPFRCVTKHTNRARARGNNFEISAGFFRAAGQHRQSRQGARKCGHSDAKVEFKTEVKSIQSGKGNFPMSLLTAGTPVFHQRAIALPVEIRPGIRLASERDVAVASEIFYS